MYIHVQVLSVRDNHCSCHITCGVPCPTTLDNLVIIVYGGLLIKPWVKEENPKELLKLCAMSRSLFELKISYRYCSLNFYCS